MPIITMSRSLLAGLCFVTVAAGAPHAQPAPVLGAQKIMAFIAVREAGRAKAFYRDTLGLTLKSEDSHALVFDANGTALRMQIVKSMTPDPYTALGWEVDDITAIADRLRSAGVTFERVPGLPQDERGIWKADERTRVAWFKDPDGNILSITEF